MHIYASGGSPPVSKRNMQDFEKTLVFALFAALLVITALPNVVFAQEEGEGAAEGGEVESEMVASVSVGEANQNTTMGYRDVANAEVIADDGTIQNPGGAGNEDINLSTSATSTDDDITTPPANLQELVNPQTIETQNYVNMEIALRGAGYAMADMEETLDVNGVYTIIVKGLEGVMQQPNEMALNRAGAQHGYYVDIHVPLDGAWLTVFKSATGSPQ